MEKRKISFFDTTLRDGEQTPGAHLSSAAKLDIALGLEQMGVDVVEAGFPAASAGDFRAVSDIAAALKTSTVAALARASKGDISCAADAISAAAHPRIHVFIATSDIHLEHKLRMTRDEVLLRVRESVAFAKTLCDDIEFSAEDATRSDPDYLCTVLSAAADAGARVINVPDTVGYAETVEFCALLDRVRREVIDTHPGAVLSVHCHNDLGLAVANSLAAIEHGASQVECTVNGIGERAGNAAFEEIVMGLTIRPERYGVCHGIDTTHIAGISRLVASLSGIPVPPTKAIVGANAFAHESGIHQHGIMCDSRTYEIITPGSVGLTEHNIVLGKLSGRHAFAERAHDLGYELDAENLAGAFDNFKNLADHKAFVTDEDIKAIISDQLDSVSAYYKLDTFQIQSGNRISAMAMITLRVVSDDSLCSEAALGQGPIDAAFNAVDRIAGISGNVRLESYNIKAVTEGRDALGEATVRIRAGDMSFTGRGVSSDIIKASIKAYVGAVGKFIYNKNCTERQNGKQ